MFIVIASLVFYGWWDWRFLGLILFTSFCSYMSGILIEKYEENRKWQKVVSVTNIVVNLSILGVFKYYNFFAENLIEFFKLFGYDIGWVTIKIILPIGISFYTFQALSYSIDVYQKKIKACHDMVAFFAFIVFFPPLLAGPIERATNLLPQFLRKRTFDYGKAVDGCRQMLWGLFKKVVVADNCATVANQIWDNYQSESGFMLLLGAIFFTFQIYCDFSGYSDMAIGIARLFGIDLMRNFNFPYFSRDVAEFWRRWHISLTTWFRDYIYIPLGGSRVSKWKVFRNTMIIFLVSGFWHGANWTFVVWGAYHAILFAPLLFLKKNKKNTNTIAENRNFPNLKEIAQLCLTFFSVLIGWIIFRSENITVAWNYLSKMLSSSLFSVELPSNKKTLLFIVMLIICEWIQREKQHALEFNGKSLSKYSIFRWSMYCILIIIIVTFAGQQAEFIYFQF